MKFTRAKTSTYSARPTERLRVEQVEWRDEWLGNAAELLRPVFEKQGYRLPDYMRVAMTRPERKALGRHYPAEVSKGGYTELFISAALAEPERVVLQLARELCSTLDKRARKNCARDLGLGGGEAPAWLGGILAKLGPFPHDAMELPALPAKQQCRNLLRQCSACGAKWRAAGVWSDTTKRLRCPDPDCEGVLR